MLKTLVLYYSYEGSTQKVAEYLTESLGLDIARVIPVKEMKSKGFGKFFLGGSQVIMKKKPKILPLNIDFDQYDLILLGSPIWAGTFAPPIHTLLESGLIHDKNIGYFYCHEGGAKGAVDKLKTNCGDNTVISNFSCPNVKNDFDNIKTSLLDWATDITK